MDDVLLAKSVFRSLSASAREELLSSARAISLKPEQVLFTRNDPADFVYIVLDGQIAIETISRDGKSVRVATLGAGQVIGELAVLGDIERSADARAVTKARLLKISGTAFKAAVRESPEFSMEIIRGLIARICQSNTQIENITLRPLRSRVAMVLAGIIADSPDRSESISITQRELAERLGASREKVNLHLQAIQQSGAIALHRGGIDVLDRALLQSFADRTEAS